MSNDLLKSNYTTLAMTQQNRDPRVADAGFPVPAGDEFTSLEQKI